MEDRGQGAGLALWIASLLALAFVPLYALSRFATDVGARDLEIPTIRAWAEPAGALLSPLLTWADPDVVYQTLGKTWVFLLAPMLLVAFAAYRRRQPGGGERWAWWTALLGYGLLTCSTVGDFWTPWTTASFMLLTIPGFLVSLLGSTLLGIFLVRRGFHPRGTAWMLALAIPGFVAGTFTIAFAGGLLFLMWAWAIAGRSMSHGRTTATTAA
jgi:hypothetical protein